MCPSERPTEGRGPPGRGRRREWTGRTDPRPTGLLSRRFKGSSPYTRRCSDSSACFFPSLVATPACPISALGEARVRPQDLFRLLLCVGAVGEGRGAPLPERP